MRFVLPMPPSINQTYGIGRHTLYKKRTAKDWEEEAGYHILIQWGNRKIISEPLAIGIRWYYKVDRDIDAGLKILLDIFQKQKVIRNDKQFRKVLYIEIEEDADNPRVEVEITDLEGGEIVI